MQHAKMIIDLKFVELRAGVLAKLNIKYRNEMSAGTDVRTVAIGVCRGVFPLVSPIQLVT